MASNDVNDYWGPFPNSEEAIDAVHFICGECVGVLWFNNGSYWANDGIDPDTGNLWETIPEGAEWVDIIEQQLAA
jgi:hypothetical protein